MKEKTKSANSKVAVRLFGAVAKDSSLSVCGLAVVVGGCTFTDSVTIDVAN